MSQFSSGVAAYDSGTFLMEVYEGRGGVRFLRIAERPVKDRDGEWNETCLSIEEARLLRAYLDSVLPDADGGGA